MAKETPMYVGTVLWFSDKLGYGFIECDDFKLPTGQPWNIYVHYSKIISNDAYKGLSKSQLVRFEVVKSTKGLMAVSVHEDKIIKVNSSIVQ